MRGAHFRVSVHVGASDLKFHLWGSGGRPNPCLRVGLWRVVGLEETSEKVRDALIAEPGLDASVGATMRAVAVLLSAWESSRAQLIPAPNAGEAGAGGEGVESDEAGASFGVVCHVDVSDGVFHWFLRTNLSTFARSTWAAWVDKCPQRQPQDTAGGALATMPCCWLQYLNVQNRECRALRCHWPATSS